MSKKKKANKDIEEALDRKDRMNVIIIGMVTATFIPIALFVFVGREEVVEGYVSPFIHPSNWSKLHLMLTGVFVVYGLGALINAGISSRKEQNLIMAYNLFGTAMLGWILYCLFWLRFASNAFGTGMLIATGLGVLALLTYVGKKKSGDPLGLKK